MAMPKQVEQELKAIEEMEAQMRAPVETGETPPESDPPEPAVPQPVEAVPNQPPRASEPPVDWEQKYRTMAGKYDAEVPRLHAQIRELSGQVQTLQQTLEAQQAKPEDRTPERLVSEADEEAFGADLIDLQRRVAREVAGQYEAKLAATQAELEQLRQWLAQTGSQVGEMTFEQRLHRAVPDFEQINTDPRWVAWLDEVDPVLRGPRRLVAQQAFEAGDVEGVAHYVSLFRQSIAPRQRDARRTELERQVAPARNATTGSTGQPQGKTYSRAEWETQFAMVDHLAARGRIDEAQTLEAELSAALQQGRVLA